MLLMNAACNYGFANRVAITRAVLDSVNNALRKDFINYELITDTLHDCVKETHINGKNVFIHRHGASEAQPKSNFNSDSIFSKTGQVVGIPGSPGRHSMICAADSGTAKTFFTVNHGAGRKLDRGEAQKKYTEDETYNEISISGASLMRRGLGDFSGESPFAYKDLSDVFDISNKSNLLNGIARLKPLAIYKG
jgi:tRNA-splicing ligase RtcB